MVFGICINFNKKGRLRTFRKECSKNILQGRIPKKSDFLERNIENDKFRQTQEQRRAKAQR